MFSPGIQMGANDMIMQNVFLGADGKLGDSNIIRPFGYIGHDFNIGDKMCLHHAQLLEVAQRLEAIII